MNIEKKNIDVDQLAFYIFTENDGKEIFLDIQSIKTNKDLFFFCFDLFCKGLVILFGTENKLLLNMLTSENFDEIRRKLKYAHIHLKTLNYDVELAELLDIVNKETLNERNVLVESIDKLKGMEEQLELSEYIFNIYLNNNVIQIFFEIN